MPVPAVTVPAVTVPAVHVQLAAAAWRAHCQRIEALGYAGVSMPDHLGAQWSPLPALAVAATVTERITVSTTVLANDFRHPALLAKELATLDVLSGGRLEVGIGAGWMTADYEQTGIVLDRPGVRIERLVEAVRVLRGLWAPGPFTFAGEHYRITGLDGFPKPVQNPGPRVQIGGGAPRILRVAARTADIVGLALDNRGGVMGTEAAASSATRDAVIEKIARIRELAADRPTAPELRLRVLAVSVCADGADIDAAATAAGAPLGLDGPTALASPHVLVGTVSQLAAELAALAALGIGSLVVSALAIEPFAPVLAAAAS
jgi:probable F420-dependent oxidoreductase